MPIQILCVAALISGVLLMQNRADCEAVATSLERQVDAQRRLLSDWGGLTRYGSENTELVRSAADADRVVFIGDEITEFWGASQGRFFPGRPYLNRGIKGQTSPQMLVRFRQDVISLKPRVVVIQAGLNDVASINSPITQPMFAENIMSMVDLAKAHNIRVVLASLTPVCDCYTKQTALRSQGKIIGMNGWLKEYSREAGLTYLDYYSALADGRNLRKELTSDGLVPNVPGYDLMSPLAEEAINNALRAK